MIVSHDVDESLAAWQDEGSALRGVNGVLWNVVPSVTEWHGYHGTASSFVCANASIRVHESIYNVASMIEKR